MLAELLTLSIGLLFLWLWCRRDRRSAETEKLERDYAATLQSIGRDVDQLIEFEIAKLPPAEQAAAREKLAAAARRRTKS